MAENRHHRRVKSSVLSNLSFIHKRSPSDGASLSRNFIHSFTIQPNLEGISCFSVDSPSSKTFGERHHNRPNYHPVQSVFIEEDLKTLGKKTLSSISLKSLSKKDAIKLPEQAQSKASRMKTKSSSNLGNLLSRPKSLANLSKEATEREVYIEKNKENDPPPKYSVKSSAATHVRHSNEQPSRKQFNENFLEEEIDLYTPKNYSPGKQRDFHETGNRPTLTRREVAAPRPKSNYLPSTFSIQDISQRVSGGTRSSAELIRRVSGRKASHDKNDSVIRSKPEKAQRATQNRSQRVLAAVALPFGAKQSKASENKPNKLTQEGDINKEFEAMLDRRNIPDHQRGKMRNLALSVKKDFIRQDWAEIAASKASRSENNPIDTEGDATSDTHDVPDHNTKRPRSRTFTLSRAAIKDFNIPSKKNKAEASLNINSRKKSSESLTSGGKSFTAASAAAAQNIIAKAKGQTPDDFVFYMRKVTKPESVEVGKLHKLRLLLRNETVAWTDEFIQQGGMQEIFGLLHRTMAVEWREEHEDALLHEVLLCLKGLSTTALALKSLDDSQDTLFPALLQMLFDEEKKGPSEFSTRNIITSLLFTYLKAAPTPERGARAKTILSYLRDPEPIESQRPVGFVLEMRRPRPYRVWCKEVVDVTKEVFWIFLHNLNVIPLPEPRHAVDVLNDSSIPVTSLDSHKSLDTSNTLLKYTEKHFPKERPPIAAAPYVGGVEWDATNYLASHLDLVNGIIACIMSRNERNQLREEMLVSGWEKCMGGTLRLCKEKFYSGVHAGLKCWVAAADEDGWDTKNVRCGPPTEPKKKTPVTAPKKNGPTAPKIALDFLEKDKTETKPEAVTNWL